MNMILFIFLFYHKITKRYDINKESEKFAENENIVEIPGCIWGEPSSSNSWVRVCCTSQSGQPAIEATVHFRVCNAAAAQRSRAIEEVSGGGSYQGELYNREGAR
jgi:hypothetical protein